MNDVATNTDEIKRFIADARAAQAERGKPLKGRKNLTDIQLASVAQAAKNLSLSGKFNDVGGHDAAVKLLTGFEELCRRNKINYPEQYRQELSTQFVEELFVNVGVFVKKPTENAIQQFVALTLYSGVSFSNVHTDAEFKSLSDAPYVFKHAAINYPSDPRKFLRKVMSGEVKINGNSAARPQQLAL